MARMTFKAGDEYAIKLSKLAAGSDAIAKKAIYQGAKIVADKIKANIPKDTGDLAESFGITKIDVDSDGDWNAKLGFDGYDRDGVPNQLKARAIESGTSKLPKKPFVRPAVSATKKQAQDAMGRVIEEETKKIMGGN